MFDANSRYAGVETYAVTDHEGRTVNVVSVPERRTTGLLGVHLRIEGERLDHLAFRYLDDATHWWRIAEMHGAMSPDQLAELAEIRIPRGRA